MADNEWLLNEDGYLNIDSDIKEIIYHPPLNVIIICTSSGIVRVLDVNSGVILQSSYLSAINHNEVTCRFIPDQNRILFCDGQAIGVRTDYNGVLLLDSILQKICNDQKDEIKFELPLSEAIILKQSLCNENEHVINELTDQITNAQKLPKKGIKAQKWNTVCLNLPLDVFRTCASHTVAELLVKNCHTPELSVASAVQERLSELSGEPVNASDRKSMASESRRRETFTRWPHMDYQWALPDQMAQAGFYHEPNNSGDDRAMCFTCTVCLVCWERTDEPWSEHERHSPTCPFVMGEYTQNVPLSVTLATNPAIDATYRGSNVSVLGTSSLSHLLPTCNPDGLVSVFNIAGKLKRTHSFYVTHYDSHILERYTLDFRVQEEKKCSIDKQITALSIVSDKSGEKRAVIVCGLKIEQNDMESSENCTYLVVYDFMYTKQDELNEDAGKTVENEPQQQMDYTIMKHMKYLASSMYKTLIPGESDEVFLPPPAGKAHNGPRVLNIANPETTDSNYSPPSTSASSLFLYQSYLNNMQNTQTTTTTTTANWTSTPTTSISDHIVELKNKTWNKKLNYSKVVQCIQLPEQCRHMEVKKLFKTQDGDHLFVVLNSYLLVYKLDFTNKMVKVNLEPSLIRELNENERPVEVNLLSTSIEKFISTQTATINNVCDIDGNVVIVCEDGAVRIIQLSTLRTLCIAKLENEKFVSAAYCNSLDRLCASTVSGSLHFYALNDTDNESLEDQDQDDEAFNFYDRSNQTTINCNETLQPPLVESVQPDGNSDVQRYFYEPIEVIPLVELKRFQKLCDFDVLKPCFCASVPAGWTECQQTIRPIRRHLKNFKSDQMEQQLTKTWRLQTDTTTWDEHIFEITLPQASNLACVDVSFQLQSSNLVPNVEITLLKHLTNSIGTKKDVKFAAVDDSVTIDMLQWIENPIVSQEYLRSQNAEILAGPIDVATNMDITDQSGILTLTSPKLFKSKVRNLLLHIRAVYNKEDYNKKVTKRVNKTNGTATKNEFYMGCDCIHELSVTIYCTKTNQQHERVQRNFMLESNHFIKSLILTGNGTADELMYVLDLLNWIGTIRLTRNRSNNGEAPNQQLEFLNVIDASLSTLLYKCFILSGRSVAHKCMRLMATCLIGAQNVNETIGKQFNTSLLTSLLQLLEKIHETKSSRSLQWIVTLLQKVTNKSNGYQIMEKCVEILIKITDELTTRSNPYHFLLRSRYGLYGTPLEPELFDIEAPSGLRGTSDASSYLLTSNPDVASGNGIGTDYSFNKEGINPKDVLSSQETKLKYKKLVSMNRHNGLIETVLLHFTCVSASDGTRLERADLTSNLNQTQNNPVPYSAMVNSAFLNKNSLQQLVGEKIYSQYNDYTQELFNPVQGDQPQTPPDGSSGTKCIDKYFDKLAEVLAFDIFGSTSGGGGGTSAPTNQKHYEEIPTNQTNYLPWHNLLMSPPQQVIVVDRMHSGAVRYIVLDFGQPVLLTDILIPSCNDLISLTVDVWLKDEEESIRLLLASDIGVRNLLMFDLQPPPLCRYVKISAIGRYGTTPTRCRIPVGYFYGHIVVLNEETSDVSKQLSILNKLFEDISCRYSLACSKLKELLHPLLISDLKNTSHLASYMNVIKERGNGVYSPENNRIFNAYQETMQYQHQLNIVRNVMARIEEHMNSGFVDQRVHKDLKNTPTHKLTTIAESILEILLLNESTYNLSLETCKDLFNGLCVSQPSRLQLLGALFLDKTCAKRRFWGNFLADTLMEMFSSQYNAIFPQDRLFILLAYLSRKSTERSCIIDAALRVLAQALQPLFENQKLLLAVSVDLPLISWLLMYLSLQLDLSMHDKASNTKWDWVFGEMVGKVSLDNLKNNKKKYWKLRNGNSSQMQMAAPTGAGMAPVVCGWSTVNNSNGAGSSPQPLPCPYSNLPLHICGSGCNSVQVMSNAAWKIEKYKYLKKKLIIDMKKSKPVQQAQQLPQDTSSSKGFAKKLPLRIDKLHCLTVVKSVLQLILSMDHSASADMLLLSFKVIAKLVALSNLQLGQIINEQQLLGLINFCITSKIPWAPFALVCFLQDVMDISTISPQTSATTPTPTTDETEESDMETDILTNWQQTNDLITDVENFCTSNNTGSNYPVTLLPSVYESEDSDIEEILDDFNKLKPDSSITFKKASGGGSGGIQTAATASVKTVNQPNNGNGNGSVSMAMDARLECGLEHISEMAIRKIRLKNMQILLNNISANNGNSGENTLIEMQPWPINLTNVIQNESGLNNQRMLIKCFESLFNNLQIQQPAYIEQILQLWLTLNCTMKDEKFDPSTIPYIPLNSEEIKSLISALAWTNGLSLTTWCIALQILTLVCNINTNKTNVASSQWSDLSGMASIIVNQNDFTQMLLRLLSGTNLTLYGELLAGPSLCKSLHDFLVRLQMRCDVVSPTSKLGNQLKTHLLKIVYQLTQPTGSIATRQGPLDAQCKLLQSMFYLDYSGTDLSIAMSILESTGALLFNYGLNNDKIKCINAGEKQNVMTNTFSDIFASVLGTDTNKQDRPVCYNDLLITLLKLLGKLVQTPVQSETELMDTDTSQTDESKAQQQDEPTVSYTIKYFADVVLQHYPTIIRLCHTLANCKTSSLCMLANVNLKLAFANLSEPNSVNDSVFYLLASIAKKASNKELIIQPLLVFLSQTPVLSEPLLWFLLQVLDTEEACRLFLNAGGINVLGVNFVNSCKASNTITKYGTISTVMQHFTMSGEQDNSVITCMKKLTFPKPIDCNKLMLTNFAPYCTIKCLSGNAQPADVLIQAVVHRRARSPLWSYHFYPEEVHTELVLQLPSAILLNEVQLQPHIGGLATCPAAVALEISTNGPSRLQPACAPLPTSGMTYIRLNLPEPKVVNCVLLRLYKPRDANSIGLLQIKLLGSTAFMNNTQNDVQDDESHCNYSLGWLRLLHHCFTLPVDGELRRQVIGCGSQVNGLLRACCGLLLVPSHVLPVYLPCLEKVLRELTLYSAENGVQTLNLLLNNKTLCEPLIFNEQEKLLINVTGYQSACELLYQICDHQDAHTQNRLQLILDWFKNVCQNALEMNNVEICNPAYISNLASILWSAKQANVSYDLNGLITMDLFEYTYTLKTNVLNNIALKYALDSLLCSMCYIHPEFYPHLLQRIGVLVANTSISDDRKDTESCSMTDDHKHERNTEWYSYLVINELQTLNLSESELETVAMVSRSPPCIQQLLDCGLPKLLNSAIFEFCLSTSDSSIPMARMCNIISILQFFTDVCDEKVMRNWLGSEDGSSFWLHLLHWLCKRNTVQKCKLQTELHLKLEEVCMSFLTKCCLCHPLNQQRLAKVLCEVISMQSNGISSFMRRLILQLLLENEKVPVSIEAEETLYKNVKLTQSYIPIHPAFKQTYNRAMLYLSTNTTLMDVLEQYIYFNTTYKMENTITNRKLNKKDFFKMYDESDLSISAGVTAKDKRAKDAKNQFITTSTPLTKKKRYMESQPTHQVTDVLGGRIIKCPIYSDQALPFNLNLGQLLRLIEVKGANHQQSDWPCIHLNISHCNNSKNDEQRASTSGTTNQATINNLNSQPFCSALQTFSTMGGLALLAQHLPTVYPEAIKPNFMEKSGSTSMMADQFDCDWIKLEECDDIDEDFEDFVTNMSPSRTNAFVSHIPTHALTAFGLFLRLPGYAEVLLRDMKKALCLLRLILGVTDDGEGGNIFQSPIADSLPTLPFEVLKRLYDATPLGTDDGRLLRRISVNNGIVHLLLACLSIFTHSLQTNTTSEKDSQKDSGKTKEEKSQLYWAKGTGFGTGSTQQSWNVEQALLKQRSEEEHVTVLLQVLASYINPGDGNTEELGDVLPSQFHELLANSSLLPAISSYLRNDSVLDMARHIPLYKAVLQLLRAIASSTQLIELLLPQKRSGKRSSEPSICSLLKNMKSCVDTYAAKLCVNNVTKPSGKLKNKLGAEEQQHEEQGESLATLMPDIQNTANLVSKVTSDLVDSDNDSDREGSIEKKVFMSVEDKYMKIMRDLQFGSYEMISEQPDGSIKFIVSHHFESTAKSTSEQSHPARVKRIAQEAVTLSTSLPLSYSSSVFVRYDTSRLDVMKVLITGPSDTPYANGCFELDVFFPADYPQSPMLINLETTGHHTVRFNPNLYNDGKVCLSVLNTWHGKPEEKWNAQTSSFLQVLVSIQSLILVAEPYFNEPGYERARGTPSGTASSKDYNLNICQATVRWAMLEQLVNPTACFKEIIQTHFYLKRAEILQQLDKWLYDLEMDVSKKKKSTTRSSSKKSPTTTLDTFKKVCQQMREQLGKLKPTNELLMTEVVEGENCDNGTSGSSDVEMDK